MTRPATTTPNPANVERKGGKPWRRRPPVGPTVEELAADPALLARETVRIRDRQYRLRTAGAITCVAFLVALVTLGTVEEIRTANGHAQDRRTAAALREHDRRATADARLAVCLQSQDDQINAITSEEKHDAALSFLLVPEPRTPAQRHQVTVDLAVLAKTSVEEHPLRDCTPKGIADYYSLKNKTGAKP